MGHVPDESVRGAVIDRRRPVKFYRRVGGNGQPVGVITSISLSPSELPKAKIGRRPINLSMATGLPARHLKLRLPVFSSTGAPLLRA